MQRICHLICNVTRTYGVGTVLYIYPTIFFFSLTKTCAKYYTRSLAKISEVQTLWRHRHGIWEIQSDNWFSHFFSCLMQEFDSKCTQNSLPLCQRTALNNATEKGNFKLFKGIGLFLQPKRSSSRRRYSLFVVCFSRPKPLALQTRD